MPGQHAGDYWRRDAPGLYSAAATDGEQFWLELHESRVAPERNTWLLWRRWRWTALDTPYRDAAFAAANRLLQPTRLVRQIERPA